MAEKSPRTTNKALPPLPQRKPLPPRPPPKKEISDEGESSVQSNPLPTVTQDDSLTIDDFSEIDLGSDSIESVDLGDEENPEEDLNKEPSSMVSPAPSGGPKTPKSSFLDGFSARFAKDKVDKEPGKEKVEEKPSILDSISLKFSKDKIDLEGSSDEIPSSPTPASPVTSANKSPILGTFGQKIGLARRRLFGDERKGIYSAQVRANSNSPAGGQPTARQARLAY